MKTELHIVAAIGFISASILAFSGCSSESKEQGAAGMGAGRPEAGQGQGATLVAVQTGEPGGLVVQTYQATATVSAIDKEQRKVTLVTPDGTKSIVKAGPEVVNFDQIQVGDQVKATVTEQLVVFVRKSGEPPGDAQSTTIALAPVGAKPGVMMADTQETTAQVAAIDLKGHKATLKFADGKSKTFKVRPDVDLAKYSTGDEVVIRSTEAVAIRVETPKAE